MNRPQNEPPERSPSSSQGHHQLHTVDVNQLRAGVKLEFPIHNDRQLLLLGKGQIITLSFLDKLKAIGVRRVIVHELELERIVVGKSQQNRQEEASLSQQSPPLTNASTIPSQTKLRIPSNGEPLINSCTPQGAVPYQEENISQFKKSHEESLTFVSNTYQEMVSAGKTDLRGITGLTANMLNDLIADSDLYAYMGIETSPDGYPVQHSKHVAMLAGLIGLRLGLDEPNMIHLTNGCLLHDAGMLKIDRKFYESPQRWNSVEFLEITKHPVYIYDILQQNRDIDNIVKSIAYQMHERIDGSGYPRNLPGLKIHPLAKIAAVADVFVALISDRPHRPGIMPYQAIEKLLKDANRGKLDSHVVRALLECVSLFPIGSYVELSDQRIAQVIRSNGANFNQPVVKAWETQQVTGTIEVIDLLEQTSFKVMRPVSSSDERLQEIKQETQAMTDSEVDQMADFWE